jgi:hypothetical protein
MLALYCVVSASLAIGVWTLLIDDNHPSVMGFELHPSCCPEAVRAFAVACHIMTFVSVGVLCPAAQAFAVEQPVNSVMCRSSGSLLPICLKCGGRHMAILERLRILEGIVPAVVVHKCCAVL